MTEFVVGLDLGQLQDYTALAVLQRQGDDAYHCRHLQRYRLGTKYNAVVDHVAGLMRGNPLAGKSDLVIDYTGVGVAVLDMFHVAGLQPTPVSIHGGDKVSHKGNTYRVPKRDLVGVLQVLLQSGRLQVAESLPEAQRFVAEALNFRVKISEAGHDSYAAWREGEHDDLVLAVALAAWWGERTTWKPAQIGGVDDLISACYGYGGAVGSSPRHKLERTHSSSQLHQRWSRRHYCLQCAEEQR